LPETGLGIGSQVMAVCQSAKTWFENCYLETMPLCMMPKNKLQKVGFEYINAPMVARDMSLALWMLKKL
jgi:hypothetical protein